MLLQFGEGIGRDYAQQLAASIVVVATLLVESRFEQAMFLRFACVAQTLLQRIDVCHLVQV